MMNAKWMAAVIAALMLGAAQAKLPPPSDEQKAKAEEAKTKLAEAAKKDAELLSQAQDRVVARYIKAQQANGIAVKPTPLQALPPPGAVPVKK